MPPDDKETISIPASPERSPCSSRKAARSYEIIFFTAPAFLSASAGLHQLATSNGGVENIFHTPEDSQNKSD